MMYGYARVSTVGQQRDGNGLEAQREQLLAAGVQEIYSDAFTGTKINRPEFDKLIAKLQPGDTLVVCKLDRIARSAAKGMELCDELLERGVSINILNMGLLNNTPTGKLIRNVMLAFAEFERDMIMQRTSEGKAVAKATNADYKEGRKAICIDLEMLREMKSRVDAGEITLVKCCEHLGISKRTWYNKIKALSA